MSGAAVRYLEAPIVAVRRTETPAWGRTVDGYTLRSGAPTSYLVRLAGETRERRVMALQFSNAGSLFLRVRGEVLFLGVDAVHALAGGSS